MSRQVFKSLAPRANLTRSGGMRISNFCYSKEHLSREEAERIVKIVQDVDMSQFSNEQSIGNGFYMKEIQTSSGSSVEEMPAKTKSAKRREQRKKNAEKKKIELEAGIRKSEEPTNIAVPVTSTSSTEQDEKKINQVHSLKSDQIFTLETLPTGEALEVMLTENRDSLLATLQKILSGIHAPPYFITDTAYFQLRIENLLYKIDNARESLANNQFENLSEHAVRDTLAFLNSLRDLRLTKESITSSKANKYDEDSLKMDSVVVPCTSSEIEKDGKVISKKVSKKVHRKTDLCEPTVKSEKVTEDTTVTPKVGILKLDPNNSGKSVEDLLLDEIDTISSSNDEFEYEMAKWEQAKMLELSTGLSKSGNRRIATARRRLNKEKGTESAITTSNLNNRATTITDQSTQMINAKLENKPLRNMEKQEISSSSPENFEISKSALKAKFPLAAEWLDDVDLGKLKIKIEYPRSSALKTSGNPEASTSNPKSIEKSEPKSSAKSPKISENMKIKPEVPEGSESSKVLKQSTHSDEKKTENPNKGSAMVPCPHVPPKVTVSKLCPCHLAQSTLSAPKKPENPKTSSLSPKNIENHEPLSKSKSPKTSEDLKMKTIAPEDSKSPEALKQSTCSAPKKSEGAKCENEKCIKIKKLMLQERNNRTIAEGELKKVDWKVKGFDKLKKEEEEWKAEKKEMEKKIKALEKTITTISSQADENKKLREENEKLKTDNERLKSSNDKLTKSHGRLETEYNIVLKEKREKDEKLRETTASMSILLKEKQALLEENQQLNGPLSSGRVSVAKKLQWHQKLQKEFNPTEVADRIKNMTEVLEKKSSEFQGLMEKEQKRLKFATTLYSRTLQYNLQLLEDTNSTTGLLPVPQVPKVSRRFEMKFDEEMRKWIPDSSTGLDINKECFICHEEFRRGQIIVKCAANKHAVHKECGVQWSKVGGGTCGYCRAPMIVKN